VQRLEILTGPAAAGFKPDSKEVTDIPVDAIPDSSHQFTPAVGYADCGIQRDRIVQLQASPACGDVFQVGYSLLAWSPGFAPFHGYEIRAKHSRF